MTPAQSRAFVVAAKRVATPVVSCVRADIRFGHLTQNLSREGLLALVAVLAECADLERLRAVTEAPGDEGMPPLSREDVLRRAHAEYTRLIRAGLPVPARIRFLHNEYRVTNKRRREAAVREAAA
jgi:hypothetical protein